jgi:hypothetical protein
MTTNDEWVKERAARLALEIAACSVTPLREGMIVAFGHAAIERGKAECGDYHEGLEEGIKIGKAEQDKAVAAEREKIAAMLRKPDPGLRHAVAIAKFSQACDGGHSIVGGPEAEAAMLALARILEGKENSE